MAAKRCCLGVDKVEVLGSCCTYSARCQTSNMSRVNNANRNRFGGPAPEMPPGRPQLLSPLASPPPSSDHRHRKSTLLSNSTMPPGRRQPTFLRSTQRLPLSVERSDVTRTTENGSEISLAVEAAETISYALTGGRGQHGVTNTEPSDAGTGATGAAIAPPASPLPVANAALPLLSAAAQRGAPRVRNSPADTRVSSTAVTEQAPAGRREELESFMLTQRARRRADDRDVDTERMRTAEKSRAAVLRLRAEEKQRAHEHSQRLAEREARALEQWQRLPAVAAALAAAATVRHDAGTAHVLHVSPSRLPPRARSRNGGHPTNSAPSDVERHDAAVAGGATNAGSSEALFHASQTTVGPAADVSGMHFSAAGLHSDVSFGPPSTLLVKATGASLVNLESSTIRHQLSPVGRPLLPNGPQPASSQPVSGIDSGIVQAAAAAVLQDSHGIASSTAESNVVELSAAGVDTTQTTAASMMGQVGGGATFRRGDVPGTFVLQLTLPHAATSFVDAAGAPAVQASEVGVVAALRSQVAELRTEIDALRHSLRGAASNVKTSPQSQPAQTVLNRPGAASSNAAAVVDTAITAARVRMSSFLSNLRLESARAVASAMEAATGEETSESNGTLSRPTAEHTTDNKATADTMRSLSNSGVDFRSRLRSILLRVAHESHRSAIAETVSQFDATSAQQLHPVPVIAISDSAATTRSPAVAVVETDALHVTRAAVPTMSLQVAEATQAVPTMPVQVAEATQAGEAVSEARREPLSAIPATTPMAARAASGDSSRSAPARIDVATSPLVASLSVSTLQRRAEQQDEVFDEKQRNSDSDEDGETRDTTGVSSAAAVPTSFLKENHAALVRSSLRPSYLSIAASSAAAEAAATVLTTRDASQVRRPTPDELFKQLTASLSAVAHVDTAVQSLGALRDASAMIAAQHAADLDSQAWQEASAAQAAAAAAAADADADAAVQLRELAAAEAAIVSAVRIAVLDSRYVATMDPAMSRARQRSHRHQQHTRGVMGAVVAPSSGSARSGELVHRAPHRASQGEYFSSDAVIKERDTRALRNDIREPEARQAADEVDNNSTAASTVAEDEHLQTHERAQSVLPIDRKSATIMAAPAAASPDVRRRRQRAVVSPSSPESSSGLNSIGMSPSPSSIAASDTSSALMAPDDEAEGFAAVHSPATPSGGHETVRSTATPTSPPVQRLLSERQVSDDATTPAASKAAPRVLLRAFLGDMRARLEREASLLATREAALHAHTRAELALIDRSVRRLELAVAAGAHAPRVQESPPGSVRAAALTATATPDARRAARELSALRDSRRSVILSLKAGAAELKREREAVKARYYGELLHFKRDISALARLSAAAAATPNDASPAMSLEDTVNVTLGVSALLQQPRSDDTWTSSGAALVTSRFQPLTTHAPSSLIFASDAVNNSAIDAPNMRSVAYSTTMKTGTAKVHVARTASDDVVTRRNHLPASPSSASTSSAINYDDDFETYDLQSPLHAVRTAQPPSSPVRDTARSPAVRSLQSPAGVTAAVMDVTPQPSTSPAHSPGEGSVIDEEIITAIDDDADAAVNLGVPSPYQSNVPRAATPTPAKPGLSDETSPKSPAVVPTGIIDSVSARYSPGASDVATDALVTLETPLKATSVLVEPNVGGQSVGSQVAVLTAAVQPVAIATDSADTAALQAPIPSVSRLLSFAQVPVVPTPAEDTAMVSVSSVAPPQFILRTWVERGPIIGQVVATEAVEGATAADLLGVKLQDSRSNVAHFTTSTVVSPTTRATDMLLDELLHAEVLASMRPSAATAIATTSPASSSTFSSPRSPSTTQSPYGRDDVFPAAPLAAPIAAAAAAAAAAFEDNDGDDAGSDLYSFELESLAATLKPGSVVAITTQQQQSQLLFTSGSAARQLLPLQSTAAQNAVQLLPVVASGSVIASKSTAESRIAPSSGASTAALSPSPSHAWEVAAAAYLDELFASAEPDDLLLPRHEAVSRKNRDTSGGDVVGDEERMDAMTDESNRIRGDRRDFSVHGSNAPPLSQRRRELEEELEQDFTPYPELDVNLYLRLERARGMARELPASEREAEALQIRNKALFDVVNEELAAFAKGHAHAYAHLRALTLHVAAAGADVETSTSSPSAELAALREHLLDRLRTKVRKSVLTLARYSDTDAHPIDGPAADLRTNAIARADAREDTAENVAAWAGHTASILRAATTTRMSAVSVGVSASLASRHKSGTAQKGSFLSLVQRFPHHRTATGRPVTTAAVLDSDELAVYKLIAQEISDVLIAEEIAETVMSTGTGSLASSCDEITERAS